MKGLKKINLLYRLGCLFDGDFDGFQVVFNRKRHLWNLAMSIVMYLIVLVHLLVFFTKDKMLRDQLIYFKVANGFAADLLNLGKFSLLFQMKTFRLFAN